MAQAIRKAKTIPVVPPMALPMKTMRTVRRERSRVVLILFIVVTSDDVDRFPMGTGFRRR
jgi:hypothetical protein